MRSPADRSAARTIALKLVASPALVRAVLLGLAFLLFAVHRATDLDRPRVQPPWIGWFGWSDQGLYLRAARAWAAHMPPPALSQTYEPGYGFLGSPFVPLWPSDPFLVVNLVAVLAACWWFGAIACAVLGERRWSREIGLGVFTATGLLDPRTAVLWTTPWTTTPVVALSYGALAAGLSTRARPQARAAFAAACAAGLAGAFRPGDLPLILPACGLAVLLGALGAGAAMRARMAAAFAVGGAVGLGAALALHVSVWGLHPSPYMIASAQVGFEWRLLPLRWVLLMDRPMPETPGAGIAFAYPYLLLGLPALLVFAASGMRAGRGRGPHLVLVCYTLLALVEFFAYRDLHPSGLWRFFNIHYFKWLFPIGALYALLLCREAMAGDRRRAAAVVALAIAMFCWCPELERLSLQDATIVDAHHVMLPRGLPRLQDAALLPLAEVASEETVIGTPISASAAARTWTNIFDYRAYPHDGNALLVPLRPIAMPLVVTTGDHLALDTERTPVLARQTIAFRLPWLWEPVGDAQIPAPFLPRDGRIDLTRDSSARYLVKGWDRATREGRGVSSAAVVAVVVRHAQDLALAIDARIVAGQRARISVKANGRMVARDVSPGAVVQIPKSNIAGDGALSLTLLTDRASRRALMVRGITLTTP